MNWILTLLERLTPYGTHSYFIMFGILLACGFGLPLPEDVVLVTGGILSSHGIIDIRWTIAVCMAGVLIGDGIVYFIGRFTGPKIRDTRFFKRLINPQREAKVAEWFQRYGDKVVFFARFAPGLRMPLFLTSGIYHIPVWKFFLLDGLAAVISVPVWVWIGSFFGSNLEALDRIIRKVQFNLYLALGGLLLAIIGFVYFKRRRSKQT